MSDDVNKHGLRRSDMNAEVRRRVRQDCHFGCVICGVLPYHYEHFEPDFADAARHDPAGIALLCPTHHQDKSSGRLSKARVALARQAPHNGGKDAVWKTAFGPGDIKFVFGGNTLLGRRAGFSVNGSPVLKISAPTPHGPWSLSGSFVNNRREVLRFEDNEVVACSGAWDVDLKGTALTVRNGPGDIAARVLFEAGRNEVVVDRLKMSLSAGFTVVVTAESTQVYQGSRLLCTLIGNTFDNDSSHVAPPVVIDGASRISIIGIKMTGGIQIRGGEDILIANSPGGSGVVFGDIHWSRGRDMLELNFPAAGTQQDWVQPPAAERPHAHSLTNSGERMPGTVSPCPCGSGALFAECHGSDDA